MSVIDKEIESAKIIIKQYGNCYEPVFIDCDYCPAERIANKKGLLYYCGYLWDHNNKKGCKQWFENWLSENE